MHRPTTSRTLHASMHERGVMKDRLDAKRDRAVLEAAQKRAEQPVDKVPSPLCLICGAHPVERVGRCRSCLHAIAVHRLDPCDVAGILDLEGCSCNRYALPYTPTPEHDQAIRDYHAHPPKEPTPMMSPVTVQIPESPLPMEDCTLEMMLREQDKQLAEYDTVLVTAEVTIQERRTAVAVQRARIGRLLEVVQGNPASVPTPVASTKTNGKVTRRKRVTSGLLDAIRVSHDGMTLEEMLKRLNLDPDCYGSVRDRCSKFVRMGMLTKTGKVYRINLSHLAGKAAMSLVGGSAGDSEMGAGG